MLAACGQKGPLYLPEPGGEVVTRPAPDAEAEPQRETEESDPDDTPDPPR